MFKRFIFSVLIVLFCIFLCSCNSIIDNDYAYGTNDDYINQASPLPSEGMSELTDVNLYYGYRGLANLIVNQSEVEFVYNESSAITVLNTLISGPDYADRHISRLINSETSVISVNENDNYVFVTLSNDFLKIPDGFEDPVISENERRYLAVASVINTMIDFGGYYRVQILIDRTGKGVGTPITNAECGLTGNDYFEPHGFLYSVGLYAQSTIVILFDLIESKNWSFLYDFLNVNESYNNKVAHLNSFVDVMNTLNLSVSDFSYIGKSEILDSSYCRVFVSYLYSMKDLNNMSKTNVPIKMVNVNNIWKVNYDDFLELWNNG